LPETAYEPERPRSQFNAKSQKQYADVVLARRRDCEYVTPLHVMSNEEIRRELDSLRVEYPMFDDAEQFLQPHVETIRARCSLGL